MSRTPKEVTLTQQVTEQGLEHLLNCPLSQLDIATQTIREAIKNTLEDQTSRYVSVTTTRPVIQYKPFAGMSHAALSDGTLWLATYANTERTTEK